MAANNIPETAVEENTVVEPDDGPRDHQINLSVSEEDWREIEAHVERIRPQFPTRRIIPIALATYDLFKRGLKAVQA